MAKCNQLTSLPFKGLIPTDYIGMLLYVLRGVIFKLRYASFSCIGVYAKLFVAGTWYVIITWYTVSI